MLADGDDPPSWEACGTSRVVWLQGNHPMISDGTVERTFCITGVQENCETTVVGKVRTCISEAGGQYFVYDLVKPVIGCQWAYCAKSVDSNPPT